MGSDNAMRASDFDRETVVEALREAYTAGRLTLEEFDERTSSAYASKTWGQLRALTADLPERPVLAAAGPRPPTPIIPPTPTEPVLTVRVAQPRRHRGRRAPLLPAALILLLFGAGAGSAVALALGAVFCLLVLAAEFADGWRQQDDNSKRPSGSKRR